MSLPENPATSSSTLPAASSATMPALSSSSLPPASITTTGSWSARSDTELGRSERRALEWSALAAALAIAWITLPIGTGILLGALLAFTMQPVYERLRARTGRPGLSALLTTILATLVILSFIGVLALLFVTRGVTLARQFVAPLAPQGSLTHITARLSPTLHRFHIAPEELTTRLRSGATELAGRLASVAEGVAAQTASLLLGLFFAVMTMYLCVRNWGGITRRAQEVLPLRPDYTRALFDEFRRVGRTTLFGTVVTGLAQGVLATLGYWMTGVPEPVFFGALTAVASLVPAVGTLLVWVPAGIVLILTGHSGAGFAELIWGAAVIIGVSDYVIRPRLVGGEDAVPTLVTFAALFGGVEVLGLKGLILGPLVMSVAVATLRLYASEMRARRQRAARPHERVVSPDPPPPRERHTRRF